MKRSIYINTFLFVLLFGLMGCKGEQEIADLREYLKWINNPEHGLVQERKVNDVRLTVKYLPPEYLAYKELSGASAKSRKAKDSLIAYYSRSRSFLLTIAPAGEDEKGDIMFRGVEKYDQYKERSYQMNFDMESFVSLATDSGSYRPVLSTLENVYGLTPQKSVYLVFLEEEGKSDLRRSRELDVVFNDEIFDTGMNHFIFTKDKIDNIPHFAF